MPKKVKKKENRQVNEPWEQPIYEVESEQVPSRVQSGRRKRGNHRFLTIVLILLFIIAAGPAVFGVWKLYVDHQPTTQKVASKESSEKSVASSSTKATSTSTTSESSQSTETSATTTESSENQTTNQNEETTSQNGEEYTTVQAGEGPQSIANRTGVSVEDIYRLNGMTADNFSLTPGQQIRIK